MQEEFLKNLFLVFFKLTFRCMLAVGRTVDSTYCLLPSAKVSVDLVIVWKNKSYLPATYLLVE